MPTSAAGTSVGPHEAAYDLAGCLRGLHDQRSAVYPGADASNLARPAPRGNTPTATGSPGWSPGRTGGHTYDRREPTSGFAPQTGQQGPGHKPGSSGLPRGGTPTGSPGQPRGTLGRSPAQTSIRKGLPCGREWAPRARGGQSTDATGGAHAEPRHALSPNSRTSASHQRRPGGRDRGNQPKSRAGRPPRMPAPLTAPGQAGHQPTRTGGRGALGASATSHTASTPCPVPAPLPPASTQVKE